MPTFDPSHIEVLFWSALALIAAACFFVPLFHMLRLGSILGYLVAGLAVQVALPGALTEHPEELLHFAEFGVVLFLFVIGLELRPSVLWSMRRDIFGLGLAQMLGCGLLLSGGALAYGYDPAVAVVIGLGLALSSTALVMQTLDERRERGTPYGRKAFAILLFQDLAIVPLLLLIAFLAPTGDGLDIQQSMVRVGVAIAAIGLLILVGRYALDPMFRLLAKTGVQEVMTASALGVVIAAALLMDFVGMSYAMGSFIAGVMLAESSYRHEIEANIEPFRGLFLGLFFVAVGLSLDLNAVADNWLLILAATPAAMLLKGAALAGVTTGFRLKRNDVVKLSFSLPQFGEFGFVLFAAASTAALLSPQEASVLIAVVTLSMALSPLLARGEGLFLKSTPQAGIEETFDDATGRILVVGFGRFGQIVAQPLFAQGFEVTILDNNPTRVQEAAGFGFRIHYGDGTRRDVLRAAAAEGADMVVVCIDNAEDADAIVARVQEDFPETKLYVRSFDRRHSIRLINAKADFVVRETFESAVRMGRHVLIGLGVPEAEADHRIQDIRERDRERLMQQAEGDISAGRDRMFTAPVKPEPLPVKDTEKPDENA